MFVLLEDILEYDNINIWLSGTCSTKVVDGIPEGGALGPRCYTVLPDDLLKSLVHEGFGVGTDFSMPTSWKSHNWECSGTPTPLLTDWLVTILKAGGALPSVDVLAKWPALEASAARALDIIASRRVVMLLHADDPVILASSKGELQRTLHFISGWCQHMCKFFPFRPPLRRPLLWFWPPAPLCSGSGGFWSGRILKE